MSSHHSQQLIELLEQNTGDPRQRLELGQQIMQSFNERPLPSDSTALTKFCDVMVLWLSASNYKVALMALDILEVALGVSGGLLAPYLIDNTSALMERLGDSKEPVRLQAHQLLTKMMRVPHASPQLVFERMMSGFTHKQWLVRIGIMHILQHCLRTFGPNSIHVSKCIPLVCKLITDPMSQVRDVASDTLLELYIYMGDNLMLDIQRKRLVPDSKLPIVMARFHEAKENGLVSKTGKTLREPQAPLEPVSFKTPPPARRNGEASSASAAATHKSSQSSLLSTQSRGGSKKALSSSKKSAPPSSYSKDEADGASWKSRASSVPAKNRTLSAKFAGGRLQRKGSGAAGAVSEEFFYNAFEAVPRIEIFSGRELTVHLQSCREILSDPNNDWNKRVEALKKLRSLLFAGAMNYDEFWTELKLMEVPFQLSVKDLRSQIVREAAITISYFVYRLNLRADHLVEAVLHGLVNLIPNSAKVMASSGYTACLFVIRNVHSAKLIPVVTGYLNSKSRDIRRGCCEFLSLILAEWEPHTLERNLVSIAEAIRSGLNDADGEARAAARMAYGHLAEHYRDTAERLYQTLDPAKQRQLSGDVSASSSTTSVNAGAAIRRSQENINRFSLPQKAYYGNRSTSDIDTGAARRAMQRRHTAQTKPPLQPMNSLQRNRHPSSSSSTATPPRHPYTPTRQSAATVTPKMLANGQRPSVRTPSKSVSQPGSRSGSPTSRIPGSVGSSSRKSATGAGGRGGVTGTPGRSSRDVSPVGGRVGSSRRYSDVSSQQQSSSSSTRYSRDAQRITADALCISDLVWSVCGSAADLPILAALHAGCGPDAFCRVLHSADSSPLLAASPSSPLNKSPAQKFSLDDFDDSMDSQASSRARVIDMDLSQAIRACNQPQWSERKEGLRCLNHLLLQRVEISQTEMHRLCDMFMRFFTDQHNKTFSVVLDVLCVLIGNYRAQLCDWLFVLLTRLLNKAGHDLLPSVHTKLQNCLSLVRESFRYEQQFSVLSRIIADPMQNTALKVKLAALNYFIDIVRKVEPSALDDSKANRTLLQKLIHFSSEPKSAEVRKAATTAIACLFTLNESMFTQLLHALPKTYQDSCTSLLQSQWRRTPDAQRMRPTSARSSLSPQTASGGLDMGYVHDRLRETSAQINQYVAGGQEERGKGSQDSGIVDAADGLYSRVDDAGRMLESLNINADEERQKELIEEILTELSAESVNQRIAERCEAMKTLKHMTRDGSFTLWDEHFKSVLFTLLEILAGDTQSDVRVHALKVIREICLCQATRFRDYAELCLLKVLEAHATDDKEVQRAVDECLVVLGTHLPPHVCLRTLNSLIKDSASPALLAAIKMLNKVLEQLSAEEVESILKDVVPGILAAYEHEDSGIRKAAVLCLVTLHNQVGEQPLAPFISALSPSKMKLLQLYIRRNNASSTSQVSTA